MMIFFLVSNQSHLHHVALTPNQSKYHMHFLDFSVQLLCLQIWQFTKFVRPSRFLPKKFSYKQTFGQNIFEIYSYYLFFKQFFQINRNDEPHKYKLLGIYTQKYKCPSVTKYSLTLSWRGPLSYRNQSINLQSKSMNWFLYDNGLGHERVKPINMVTRDLIEF